MAKKNRIQKSAAKPKQGNRVKVSEAPHRSTLHDKVLFSFEHFNSNVECPSKWKGPDMKRLFNLLKKASKLTWKQASTYSGCGDSSCGIGFKVLNKGGHIPCKLPQKLSQDLDISEMRVGDAMRIFGARAENIYYVIRLKRQHM